MVKNNGLVFLLLKLLNLLSHTSMLQREKIVNTSINQFVKNTNKLLAYFTWAGSFGRALIFFR